MTARWSIDKKRDGHARPNAGSPDVTRARTVRAVKSAFGKPARITILDEARPDFPSSDAGRNLACWHA
jgi:hypothetical protein